MQTDGFYGIKYMLLYYFAAAAIKRYCRLGHIKNTFLFYFSHSSGDCKFKIKVSAGLVLPEASLFCLQTLPPHCHSWPFLCAHTFLVSLPLLMRTPVRLHLGPRLTLITSFKALFSNTLTLEVRISANEFGRDDTIQPITIIESN